jgi:hypothetical protein
VALRTTLKGLSRTRRSAPLRDRRMHALALGIAAVCYRDIARSEGEMLERFAGMDSADQHLETLQGDQVYREVQAMSSAWRA